MFVCQIKLTLIQHMNPLTLEQQLHLAAFARTKKKES